MLKKPALRLLVLTSLCLAGTLSFGVRAAEDEDVVVRFSTTPQGSRVILEFTERPEYQVRQERERVVVRLRGSYRSIPFNRRNLGEPVLNSYRLARRFRRTDLVFETGPDFGSVSSFEMADPFRIVIDFERESTVRQGAPPGVGRPVPAVPIPPDEEEDEAPDEAEPWSPPETEQVILPKPEKPGIHVIVVDPGHGGEETGARGPGGLLEKNIALDVARRVKRGLKGRLGVEVLLTRDSDRDLSLDDRTAIANHNRADLFLSIHANASQSDRIGGAETYFLSYQATDDEARTLAALENNSVGLESPSGNSDLELILWDLAQAQYLEESSELAETIQNNLNELLGIRSRGIKQAPFRVLMGATMPAVLVEIGFITNREEEARLSSGDYRERIAKALVDSVATFKERMERRLGLR